MFCRLMHVYKKKHTHTRVERLNKHDTCSQPSPPFDHIQPFWKTFVFIFGFGFVSVFEIWSCYVTQDGLTHYVHECRLKFGEILLPLPHLDGFLFLFWWESLI